VDKSNISIGISGFALLISAISIILSILSYRKDRWKLSLEAWIHRRGFITEGQVLMPGAVPMPNSPTQVRGELFVKMANIGRRAVTIEKICLQIFEDEIDRLKELTKPSFSGPT